MELLLIIFKMYFNPNLFCTLHFYIIRINIEIFEYL